MLAMSLKFLPLKSGALILYRRELVSKIAQCSIMLPLATCHGITLACSIDVRVSMKCKCLLNFSPTFKFYSLCVEHCTQIVV